MVPGIPRLGPAAAREFPLWAPKSYPQRTRKSVTHSFCDQAHRRPAPEVHRIAPIVPIVLLRVRVYHRWQPLIVSGISVRVVVDEVYTARGRHAVGRQGAQCGADGAFVEVADAEAKFRRESFHTVIVRSTK